MAETVLVTGAFGLVGSATVRQLRADGRRVVATDLDVPANRKKAAAAFNTCRVLLAQGFSVELLSGLVLTELATVVTEPTMAHRGATFMVERIRITDAGRMLLEE